LDLRDADFKETFFLANQNTLSFSIHTWAVLSPSTESSEATWKSTYHRASDLTYHRGSVGWRTPASFSKMPAYANLPAACCPGPVPARSCWLADARF
jgi:hypothetical protein